MGRFATKIKLMGILCFALLFGFANQGMGQVTFEGNGNTGFGDIIGNSSLEISEDGDDITFSWNGNSLDGANAFVIYIDSKTGGLTDLSGVNDTGNGGDATRRAVSAPNSNIFFPPGFEVNYAISATGDNINVFEVLEGDANFSMGFIANFSRTQGGDSFNITLTRGQLGIGSSDPIEFKIIGTVLNQSNSFRSNEAFGDFEGDDGSNVGENPVTFTTYFDYPSGFVGANAETAQAGNWDDNDTWINGNPPLETDDIVIGHDVVLNTDAPVSDLTINDGSTLTFEDNESRVLTFLDGGSLTNNGNLTANDGKVVFAGAGTVSGDVEFNDIDLQGVVSLGSNSSIAGILNIQPNGAIDGGNAPVYLNNSTLRFSTGNTESDPYVIGEGSSWFRGVSAGEDPQQGVPYNVEIIENTFVRSEVGNNVFRDLKNNLVIDTGSGLINRRIEGGSEDSGLFVGNDINLGGELSGGSESGGNRIIVDGNVTILENGNLVSGLSKEITFNGDLHINNGGAFTLGDQVGGDLRIRGNWTNEGTFNANNRAVYFDGSAPQTIENTTESAIEIPYLFIENDVTAISDMTVAEQLDVDGSTLTINSGNSLITPTNLNYPNDGKIRYERLITSPDFEENAGDWVALSSPIEGNFSGSGGLLEKIWTQGFPGSDAHDNTPGATPNVIEYDGESSDWSAPSDNNITPGKGFFVFLYENKDRDDDGTSVDYGNPFSITGEENTFTSSEFEFDVHFNGTDEGDSWNLLGNPFGAALDWESEDWTKENLTSYAYIYDPENKQYRVTGDDGDIETILMSEGEKVIAPFQAFWVKASDENPELKVERGARTIADSNAELFKQVSNPVLALKLEAGKYSSATAFRFSEQYPVEFSEFDAYFLRPMSDTFTYLYSVNDGKSTLLKSLPKNIEGPLELQLNAGGYINLEPYQGSATLTWPEKRDFPNDWQVELLDNKTGSVINLREVNEYQFEILSEESAKIQSIIERPIDASPVLKSAEAQSRFTLKITPGMASTNEPGSTMPERVALNQNYPNPFNPSTVISYQLSVNSDVTLEVFDMTGRKIATLVNGQMSAGTHEVTFDASNLSSGVYIYRLQTQGMTLTRKLTLIK